MGKVPHIVVDTNALVNSISIQEFGEAIYAVHEVISEVRDAATKQRLRAIPFDINFREPNVESIQIVTDCSKVTGDYASLSAVDIKLIALTLDLTREHWPELEIKTKLEPVTNTIRFPKAPTTAEAAEGDKIVQSTDDQQEGLSVVEEVKKLELEIEPNENEKPQDKDGNVKDNSGPGEDEESDESESDDDESSEGGGDENSDDGGWITPQNYKQKMYNIGGDSQNNETSIPIVACATKDFAMQNVLLQMGLKVLNNGRVIKNLRTYILRCYACFQTTSKMEKKFCPSCGNQTLKRVAVSYNSDGSHVIHLSNRVRLSGKGKRFSLPKPQGGKYSHNPVLCADHQAPHQRPSKMAIRKCNPLDPDYIAGDSPFAANDVYSRASHLGFNGGKKSNRKSKK